MYRDFSTKKDRLKKQNFINKFVKYLKTSNNFKLIL
jgi:hypothetical protein